MENQGCFLAPLEEIIAAVCEEKTWVLPVHDRALDNLKGRNVTIDLGSSALAWEIATADALIGDKLSPETHRLIRENLERRNFAPFRNSARGHRGGNCCNRVARGTRVVHCRHGKLYSKLSSRIHSGRLLQRRTRLLALRLPSLRPAVRSEPPHHRRQAGFAIQSASCQTGIVRRADGDSCRHLSLHFRLLARCPPPRVLDGLSLRTLRISLADIETGQAFAFADRDAVADVHGRPHAGRRCKSELG